MISRDAILSCIAPPGGIERYAREYYDIMLLYFLLNPLMYVLAATLVADGGEKLAAVANVTSIALNVALSILFVGPWEIRGIAIATVLSRLVFLLLVSIHFFGKKNTLRLCRHWKWADGVAIVKNGVVPADSFRQYVVANMMVKLERKANITTIGYNRNELFFDDPRTGA